MERFNLDTWLQDKSRKVIDDDGFSVEIIKWDANEKCPVVYLNHNGIAYNVSVDGMYDADPNHGLFFADDKFTEFDKELRYWSEEDEKKIMWLVRLISTAGFRELDNDKMPCSRIVLLDWLKSIKDRVQPNHWKPSEQNIKDLEWCADLVKDKMGVGFHRLQVFIDELKKL